MTLEKRWGVQGAGAIDRARLQQAARRPGRTWGTQLPSGPCPRGVAVVLWTGIVGHTGRGSLRERMSHIETIL